MSSGSDFLDQDPAFRWSDLEVEVAQKVHAEDAVDAMAKVSNIYVHAGYREPERGKPYEANDVAMFLRDRRTDDAPGNAG